MGLSLAGIIGTKKMSNIRRYYLGRVWDVSMAINGEKVISP